MDVFLKWICVLDVNVVGSNFMRSVLTWTKMRDSV